MKHFARWASYWVFLLTLYGLEAGTVTTKDGQGYTGLVKFEGPEHLSVGPLKGGRK